MLTEGHIAMLPECGISTKKWPEIQENVSLFPKKCFRVSQNLLLYLICDPVSKKCFPVSKKCFPVSQKCFLFFFQENVKQDLETGKHLRETRKHFLETGKHFWKTGKKFQETGNNFGKPRNIYGRLVLTRDKRLLLTLFMNFWSCLGWNSTFCQHGESYNLP